MASIMAPVFPALGYSPVQLHDEDNHHLSPIIEEDPRALDIAPYTESIDVTEHVDGEDNVKVVIRVRPPLKRELQGFSPFDNAILIDPTQKRLTLSENLRAAATNGVEDGLVYNSYNFSFDRIYGAECSQTEIYEESARSAVMNVLQGYNASIVAFGQTGAGKTYTMTGELVGPDRGIIPRAIEDVFTSIQRDTGEACKFLVRASYLQIYNEVISDLLKLDANNLTIREDKKGGVRVEGLSEWVVRTPNDVYELMERGARNRATGATKLNELSSRSHAIFMLVVEKSTVTAGQDAPVTAGSVTGYNSNNSTAKVVQQTVRVGKLNLVDLAGSERVHITGATGRRLEESKKINQSLSALGNVIAALTDPKGRNGRPHIPYRDSKLTRILEDSLGGNCKTTFMAMVSPAVEAFQESLSTLKFAHRTKCVKNAPKVNEDADQKTLLRKYERELKKLRAELQQKSKDLVDKRLLLKIEEARRREQADKIAAITALERQSKEIAKHKHAMATLQNRIASMQSQLLVGGQKVEDTPQFRTLLAREQDRIRKEYEIKLNELEAERQCADHDRAQAVRYKNLLLKQRDIMVMLTNRLNDRDEQVLALQAQVDVLGVREKELEDTLDEKTAELITLQKAVEVQKRNNIPPTTTTGPVLVEEDNTDTMTTTTIIHDVPAMRAVVDTGADTVGAHGDEAGTNGPQEVMFGGSDGDDDTSSIGSPVKGHRSRTLSSHHGSEFSPEDEEDDIPPPPPPTQQRQPPCSPASPIKKLNSTSTQLPTTTSTINLTANATTTSTTASPVNAKKHGTVEVVVVKDISESSSSSIS